MSSTTLALTLKIGIRSSPEALESAMPGPWPLAPKTLACGSPPLNVR